MVGRGEFLELPLHNLYVYSKPVPQTKIVPLIGLFISYLYADFKYLFLNSGTTHTVKLKSQSNWGTLRLRN